MRSWPACTRTPERRGWGSRSNSSRAHSKAARGRDSDRMSPAGQRFLAQCDALVARLHTDSGAERLGVSLELFASALEGSARKRFRSDEPSGTTLSRTMRCARGPPAHGLRSGEAGGLARTLRERTRRQRAEEIQIG